MFCKNKNKNEKEIGPILLNYFHHCWKFHFGHSDKIPFKCPSFSQNNNNNKCMKYERYNRKRGREELKLDNVAQNVNVNVFKFQEYFNIHFSC